MPNLKKLAIKILCQPCSASGCERNWSTFEDVHLKKHNKFIQEHLNDLEFVHYYLCLHHRDQVDAIDPSDPIFDSSFKDLI